MKSVLRTFCLLSALSATPAFAASLSVQDQVSLQAAMQQYIDSHAVKDALLQIDASTGNINEYVVTKAHPKMMTWGSNAILCSDFVDQSGKTVMGNFYVARTDNGFVVFQVSFGMDPVLDKLMKDGKAVMAN